MVAALESLNDIEHNIFMILAVEVDDELENFSSKCQRHGSDANLVDNRESNKVQVKVLEFPSIDISDHVEIHIDLAICSRVNTFANDSFL